MLERILLVLQTVQSRYLKKAKSFIYKEIYLITPINQIYVLNDNLHIYK